ncbi:MAG TPA: hypothetical protein VGF08_08650 [Terriglobales bacterium]|jgi:hypothetical protein
MVSDTFLVVRRVLWLVVVLGMVALQPAALGQGIHVSLRGKANPVVVSLKSTRYTDVQASGNYAYVGSFQNSSGVLIFDISNPSAPVQVSKYQPANTSLDMEYLQVANNVGYFASGRGGGVHIVNLSDPLHPALITRLTSANGAYDNVENVTIDGTHLYIPNYRNNSSAIQIWDVSTPATPFLITTVYGTDGVASHDVTVIDNRMYVSGWGGNVDIWDVTDVDHQPPTLLGTFQSESHVQFSWPTEDGHYLVCPHELATGGDVRIYDISNPASVSEVAILSAPAWGISAVAPEEVKIVGNLLYVAWDQAGLIIFDISDPTHPVMVGSYDTYPGLSTAGPFEGAWAVYPFLGQDKVLVTDQATGVHVLDATGVSQQPALYNVSMTPAKTTGGLNVTGKVFLVGLAQLGDFPVSLSSSGPVPANLVTVPAGQANYSFSQSTSPVSATTTATVTATDGAFSASTAVTLTPPVTGALSLSPASVVGGNSSTASVYLNAPAAVDTAVTINVVSGGAAVASIPTGVTVPAGMNSVTFSVVTRNVTVNTSVKISVVANGITKTATLTVTKNIPASVSFNPNSVTGGTSSNGTVTLAAPVGVDTTIPLAVTGGAGAVAAIPSSVTVPAGTNSASFAVVTKVVTSQTSVKVSVTLNGTTKTGTLTVH